MYITPLMEVHMSNQLQTTEYDLRPEETALLLGDLSRLTPEQRGSLYTKVCQSLGLNPLTVPFAYIKLNGKETLYATRNCTDQLRSIKNVSLQIVSRERSGDLYIVTARASLSNGRCDESIGAVTLTGLKGDALANQLLKCETKAKRRVTLSICGLSFMDETEADSIKDAKVMPVNHPISTSTLPAISPPDTTPTHEVDDFNAAEVGCHDTHLAPDTAPEYLPTNVDPDRGQDELDEYLGIDMSDIQHKVDTYVITFGKYTGKSLSQVGLAECQRYTQYIKDQAARDGKEIKGKVMEFIDMVDLYSKVFQHETDKNYWRDNGHTAEHRENKNQPHY